MISIGDVLMFQIGGYYGGSIGNILLSWEQAGFFTYVLPFLLIFAVVFGILTRTKMFGAESKGINAVISIVIGLLALQFDFVPMFFAEIFPRLGVGLSVILALLILIGMFLPEENNKYTNWLLLIVAVIVFIVVLAKSFGQFYWWNSVYNIYYNPNIILGIIIVAAFIAVISSASKNKFKVPEYPQPVYRGAG